MVGKIAIAALFELSGGEKKSAAIVSVLSLGPRVLETQEVLSMRQPERSPVTVVYVEGDRRSATFENPMPRFATCALEGHVALAPGVVMLGIAIVRYRPK